MTEFVHLHCHTEYSLLDGAISLRNLCAKAHEFSMPAAAITDHGNLFGAIKFYKTAKEFGLKPIIGCEFYVAPKHRRVKQAKTASDAGFHLVLLAKNKEGYHNLIKLVSAGYLEGFYYKPRIDKELLAKWNEGLIALSACLKGEIPMALQSNDFDRAKALAGEYASFFPDNFYLEMQANGIPEQEKVNQKLQELARECNLPLVASNDCHYLNHEDVEAHDILLCIQTNACVQDKKRMRFNTEYLYYRSPQEMAQAFSHCPEALSNTLEISRACNLEIDLGKHHFPVYSLPQGKSLDKEFRQMAEQGLQERLQNQTYAVNTEEYWKRLQEELDIICQKGFAGYFLIVQDFINWAKSHNIPVGPGRGSAAGCLTAYALKITNLDPLRYNLLFERFLNIERESLPDIDVDFCYHRREDVIKYVTQKYGQDCVAQITTFGSMKARAVVRDVGRALGLSFQDTDKIAKLIPEELNMTINKALEQEPELQEKTRQDPTIAKLIDISIKLEGLVRHASTHAAGIVISDRPMQEYLPLYKGKKGELVTQYDMKDVEKVGLIKFDFLGLKTLTVLHEAIQLAKEQNKSVPDLDNLPLDDPQTYALLCKGKTDGIFQLESTGMRGVLTDLQPNCFEDIIALLALYRPGPLESGMVTDFIRRKHREIKVEYPHPKLEPVLKHTYGVILYQEQVMRIASELANYSLGDGDILRRAMGKKDPAVMSKQRTKFVQGAQENGISAQEANHIFDLMEKFAGYGFNKSHSAAYAMISYQTAYMKAHYPLEFMAALITSEVNNTDKVISHINACREMNINVQKPDINQSFRSFSVIGENILFGLSGIKNVGDSAIEEILHERQTDGAYKNLLDLCQRVNLQKVSKRVLESLIKSGCMDCFGSNRAAMAASLDKVMQSAQKKQREKKSGQLSLLSMFEEEKDSGSSIPGIGMDIPEAELEEWPDETKLSFEKETLGFYLSGHPLFKYQDKLQMLQINSLHTCRELGNETEVRLALLMTSRKEHVTKKGEKMAFCQVEDLEGSAELTVFPDVYTKIKSELDFDQPIYCKAKISSPDKDKNNEDKKIKLIAQEIKLLSQVQPDENQSYKLQVESRKITPRHWEQLKRILQRYPGKSPVQIHLLLDKAECLLQLSPDYNITPQKELGEEINEWRKGTTSA